jgi:RNA polymerase subunit RPABC4/transcription elongation factor Spt4
MHVKMVVIRFDAHAVLKWLELLDATTACQQYGCEIEHRRKGKNMTCQNCGAEYPTETNFCRQCGAPIASEQTTALLDDPTDSVTTQRMESRATGPNRRPLPDGPTASVPDRSRRPILIGALVIAVIGLISVVGLLAMRNHDNQASSDLIYPGAKTVLDMKNERGGRALHLETSDSFTAVEAWYQKALKPEKTVRLTSTSVVLKNPATTATIVAEGNKTNILIKVTD